MQDHDLFGGEPFDHHAWITGNEIDEVECLVPDMTGVPRGKILPASKFLKGIASDALRIPEELFILTVTGRYWPQPTVTHPASIDLTMKPVLTTLRRVPWHENPTASVICDVTYADGRPVDIAPREVLKRVLKEYEKRGLKPVVAPELEFYLVKKNLDPDYPLEPAVGRSGREEAAGQAYGVDAANDFDDVVEDIYDWCEEQGIDIDTISHESGPAQLEINFNHGDPLELADQVLRFKRTVRQAAIKHGIYATFMAKPHENEPGSSMHIHQSVLDARTGRNIFATEKGRPSARFYHFIGGLQRYMGAAMPFFAPNVNSYRRLVPFSDAPTTTHWGFDNRTAPIRAPRAEPENFRVENRVPGADANPYLAIAVSLACGLLGLKEKIRPTDPVEGSCYRYAHSLPLTLEEALSKLGHAKALKQLLGERFIEAYVGVKEAELDQWRRVISSWEREHLLLNV